MTMTMTCWARGPVVAEFLHIDPEGLTDRELAERLAKGQDATHDCIHRIEAQGKARDEAADQKREDLKAELLGAIGGLGGRISVLEGGLEALAEALGAQIQSGAKKIKVVAPLTLKGIGGVALGVLGGVAGAVIVYRILAMVFPALHEALMSVQL